MLFNNMCQWSYDAVRDCLTAILPNGTIIETTLNKSVLNGDGLTTTDFTVDDFDKVSLFLDLLEPLQFPEHICQRLVYSAIACQHFLLPKQPQNWFFSILTNEQMIAEPSLARCFVKSSQSWVNVLVTNVEGDIADIILLEQELVLAPTTIYFGSPLRININRLESLVLEFEIPETIVFKQYA